MLKTLVFRIVMLTIVITTSTAFASDIGKHTYETACAVCHESGIIESPKFRDATAWKARIATGKEALYNSALKGKGAMPIKGGRADLSDTDVKAAVDYMVAEARSLSEN